MIFITTSSFSSYAVSYAREVGMELIDGCKLMQLLKEYLFLEETSEINIIASKQTFGSITTKISEIVVVGLINAKRSIKAMEYNILYNGRLILKLYFINTPFSYPLCNTV